MRGLSPSSVRAASTWRLITVGVVSVTLLMWIVPQYAAELPKQYASDSWPTATATVIQSETYWRKGIRDIRFRYRFIVADRTCETSKRRAVALSGYYLIESAKKFAAAHPVGSTLTVWYDPADPGVTTIVPGWSILDLALPVVVISCMAVGCARISAELTGRTLGTSSREGNESAVNRL